MLLELLLAFSACFVACLGDGGCRGGCRESPTTVSGSHAPKGRICSGDLIFDEDFHHLDKNLWQHERKLGNVNFKQFEWYDDGPNNSYVENGHLHLKPTLTADRFDQEFLYNGKLRIANCTSENERDCEQQGNGTNIINPIVSVRMHTNNTFAFKYGKIEVRLQAPVGDWLWPAFWMMPRDNQVYTNWPACGEVDIYEARGNRNLTQDDVNVGTNQACSTLHWGPNRKLDQYKLTNFKMANSSGFDQDFHRFQMQWTPDNITLSLDDKVTGVIIPPDGGFWELGNLDSSGFDNPWKFGTKMAPFDKEFYFIIDLAVGGVTFFSDYAVNRPYQKPWFNNSTDPATEFWEARGQWLPTWDMNSDRSHLKIDYVRVWAI